MTNRLRELRQERGLAQHKIGQVLDLPQSKVSDIERGKRKLHLDEALKLARFLGIKVDDLAVKH